MDGKKKQNLIVKEIIVDIRKIHRKTHPYEWESTETVKVRIRCCRHQAFDFSDTDYKANVYGLFLNIKELAVWKIRIRDEEII